VSGDDGGDDVPGRRPHGRDVLTNIVAHPAGPTLGLAPVSASRVSAFGVEFSGSDLSGFSNPFRWQA